MLIDVILIAHVLKIIIPALLQVRSALKAVAMDIMLTLRHATMETIMIAMVVPRIAQLRLDGSANMTLLEKKIPVPLNAETVSRQELKYAMMEITIAEMGKSFLY